jgi:hypothetical protein
LDDGKVIWISYFKNPLVGFLKETNQWFIAYSPSNFYNWANSLAYDGKRIWFGVHTESVIFSFEYKTQQLLMHRSIDGIKFDCLDTYVSYKNGILIVNDRLRFTQKQIDKVCSESRAITI